jgi:pimeloyl-ACP methyl ester carboxylesterase
MPHSLTKSLFLAIGALAAIIIGLAFSAHIQAGGDVSVTVVHFRGQSGADMRALLFRPLDATAEHPRPGILAVHGYLNSAEMQGNFATEFARRGYVVLAPDQRGHGASDPAAFADGFGGPDALRYLRSLPFVDRENIGLEGHSMGGWTVLAAAAAVPDGYRSLILEGSGPGAPFAPAGTASFPRNLLVVYGTRDEFGAFMWGKEAPLHTGATEKMMTTFGTTTPVEPGRLYGDIEAGTARMFEAPFVSHAWLHESRAGITPAILWFGRTLKGGRPLPADDQRWQWREAGAALALIGIPALIAGMMGIGAHLFGLARTDAVPSRSDDQPARSWELIVFSLGSAILYLPLTMLSEAVVGQNWLLRQTFSNQFALWAGVCALLAVLSVRFGKRPAPPLAGGWRAAAIAILAVGAAFPIVLAGDALGHVDPSWWFITVRPLSLSRFRDFLLYLPFFAAFATASLYALDAIRPLDRGSTRSALILGVAAMSGGFILFLAIQYGALLASGALLLPAEGLRTIMAIGFVPMFATVGIFGVLSRRWTGSVLTGGLVSGLFVTWVLTATQPIGV